MKRLSTILLLVLIVTMAFSLTSCGGVKGTIVDMLLENYPEEGHAIIELTHELGDQLNGMIDNFLEFEWAKAAWHWANDFFGITKSIQSIKGGVEAISKGEDIFQAILSMVTGVSILFVGGALLVVVILVSVLFDIIAEVVTVLLTLFGLVALVALIIVGLWFII